MFASGCMSNKYAGVALSSMFHCNSRDILSVCLKRMLNHLRLKHLFNLHWPQLVPRILHLVFLANAESSSSWEDTGFVQLHRKKHRFDRSVETETFRRCAKRVPYGIFGANDGPAPQLGGALGARQEGFERGHAERGGDFGGVWGVNSVLTV